VVAALVSPKNQIHPGKGAPAPLPPDIFFSSRPVPFHLGFPYLSLRLSEPFFNQETNMKSPASLLFVPVIVLALCELNEAVRSDNAKLDAFDYNRLLGRGVNLGNALEAPREGVWGLTLEADYFQQIRNAGFDSVRIPIRWSAHGQAEAPYQIDPAFFERVDWGIKQALSCGLVAVINVHHFEELYREPDKCLARFLALWRQIAARYRNQPDRLFFELLNEPHGQLTDEHWQRMIPQLLSVIRKSNPRRAVVIGPGQWNNLEQLGKLDLPPQDQLLIATFHYYRPFPFTHQGAEWVSDSKKWKGTTWKGTPQEVAALCKDFEEAAAWSKKNRRPLFLGEFGAYSAADMNSRARWTRAVRQEAERRGFSWCYWEFGSGFGLYDPRAKTWRQPLLRALLDNQP
jgi:endoglucanase